MSEPSGASGANGDAASGANPVTGRGNSQGRGGNGRGARGGRGHGSRGRASAGRGNGHEARNKKKFVGESKDMNKHVFQTFVESNDQKQFTKTVEALGRWASVTLKQSGDLLPIYRELKNPNIEEP